MEQMDRELLKNEQRYDRVRKSVINMEIYLATNDNVVFPHGKKRDVGSKEEKMNNKDTNLKQSANYLIQMFFKTGKRYSCTRTKIGKLLSIVAFSYAREGIQLFEETIYKYDDCGTAINELKAEIDRDVYMQEVYYDDEMPITVEFDEEVDIPDKHEKTDELSEDVKTKIEEIFREFGSYSSSRLGQFINPIVNCGNIANEKDEIELEHISILRSSDFITNENNNKLVNYLFDNGEIDDKTCS